MAISERGARIAVPPAQAASGSAGLRADQAHVPGAGGHRRGQRAGDRRDLAVEIEFADRRPAVQRVGRQDAHDNHQRQGDRQIVVAAFLGQVGRRQVGDDALGRQGQAKAGERRAHPLLALGHRLVG